MSTGGSIKMQMRSSETKLIEEKHRLDLLKDSLTRANALTSGMLFTLDNFERKLQAVDELITPLNNATNKLSSLVTNVDQSLTLMESVIHYYDICNELTSTISSGPGGNLNDYLGDMDRLEDAVKYFRGITAVSERERVTELFEKGRQQLVEESDKLITRYSNPLSGKELLELATNHSNDIHSMQEADMEALRRIIDWFSARGFRQALIDSYAIKKGTMIRRSLQLLAEHHAKSIVRRISVNPTTSNLSQSSSAGSENSKQQEKKSGESSRANPRTSTTGSLSRGSNASVLNAMVDESYHLDPSDERETNNHKVLLDALIILLQRERNLLNYVFPQAMQSLVFTKLIELPLTYMREEAQRLCQSVEKSPQKLDAGKFAIYGIFAILQWFVTSRPIFAQLYQESDSARRQQLTSLSETFQQSAVNCLAGALDEVRTDTSPVSQGGNVHSLTSQVLAFMEGLLNYGEIVLIIASLYVQQKQNSSSSASASGKEKGLRDLGIYFVQLIRSLHENIAKKTEANTTRPDATLRVIFLLNNINYLLKRLEKSPLLAIIQRCEPSLKSTYEADFETNVKEFTKCFSPMIAPIRQMFEYETQHHLPNTKMRDRDREKLKESFAAVNSAIDTIKQQCEKYLTSDVELRQRLRQESKQAILDEFKKFYEKFAHKEFTKHREKYIRYEPPQFESMLENFF